MADFDSSRDDSGSYELDLESDATDFDAAFRDAVEAVEHGAEHGAERSDDERDVTLEPEIVLDTAAAEPAEAAMAETAAAAEVAQLKDRLARTLADFDNFRKRVEREKEAARRYAHTEPLRDLLGVLDNLERAQAASGTVEDLKVGVEMIVRQLGELLRRHGVERVAAVGSRFDPNAHEAVSRVESGDVAQPTVTAEHQPGYRYHDRLLRPAMVTVAMPSAPVAMAAPTTPSDDPDAAPPAESAG